MTRWNGGEPDTLIARVSHLVLLFCRNSSFKYIYFSLNDILFLVDVHFANDSLIIRANPKSPFYCVVYGGLCVCVLRKANCKMHYKMMDWMRLTLAECNRSSSFPSRLQLQTTQHHIALHYTAALSSRILSKCSISWWERPLRDCAHGFCYTN